MDSGWWWTALVKEGGRPFLIFLRRCRGLETVANGNFVIFSQLEAEFI